jgi:threonine/homoserine/homoserine lactone efflux protein
VEAFGNGVLAGLGIAVPVGPITVLVVDQAMRRGFRFGAIAGVGAATADLIYATLAALIGAAAAAALEPYAGSLRATGAGVLGAIVAYRMWRLLRPSGAVNVATAERSLRRTYVGFLGLTLLNPLTITYFAALILGLQSKHTGPAGKVLFVAGAFAASAGWQLSLAAAGAALHHRLTDRTRFVTGLAGSVIIAALAVRLAVSA